MEDKRFKHITTDPKFRRIPKGEQKVKIDQRFASMFKDNKFKIKYTTDKRGRPVNHTTTEDLRRYYDLSSEDESTDNEVNDEVEKTNEKSASDEEKINELKVKHTSDKTLSDNIKKKLKNLGVDYARGETALYSESSSDDEETDEFSEEETIEHKWGELDADADRTEEATPRLAACNMDWDRMRATDLMVLFNSFLPAGGVIRSVAIYPSEFGKVRMKEEEIKGPIELVESSKEVEDNNKNEDEEGSGYHMEKLRRYQLNRLKYYYSVITFDSANTANKIYTECDGMEYESSAVKLDLRFIPDDMEFDDEPKDFCDKLPEVNKYQPRFFTTTALQQAKVDLTWDETNPDRLEFTQKINSGKVDDISQDDLQNYLASSSEEENEDAVSEIDDEETGGNVIDKYKALLQDIEDKEKSKNDKDVEMEISWGISIKEKTEKLAKEKLKTEEKTPFQQYLEKRKERRKQKREERKQKLSENKESNSESESDAPSDIDLTDPYFAEEFDKPEFKKKVTKKKDVNKDDSNEQHNDAELELLLMNENDDKKNFSLKKIQESEKESKKKKKKAENVEEKDDFQINVADERFSALFTSHHYNIDPTDPRYKKTKAMDVLINEKLKKRKEDTDEEMKRVKKPKTESRKKAELNLLVKSVKRKTNDFKKK